METLIVKWKKKSPTLKCQIMILYHERISAVFIGWMLLDIDDILLLDTFTV